MFTLLLAAVLVLIGLILLFAEVGDGGAFVFFLIVAIVIVAFGILVPYTGQLSDFSSVKQKQSEINLFTERKDNLTAVIKTELAKYPEYEKKIMGGITPQILLQFPQLKSNETIVKTVESIVNLENDVYKLRRELIEFQTNIYWREISPWILYATPYEKFFGEKNPVAAEKK